MRELLKALRAVVLVSALTATSPALAQGSPGRASGQDGSLLVIATLLPMTGGEFHTLWNTPRETTPSLTNVDALQVGETATYVLFIGGPRRAGGYFDVLCRVVLVADDASEQVLVDGPCLADLPATAPVTDLYAAQVFDFQPPPVFGGTDMVLDAQVTDQHSGAQVTLRLTVPVLPAPLLE